MHLITKTREIRRLEVMLTSISSDQIHNGRLKFSKVFYVNTFCKSSLIECSVFLYWNEKHFVDLTVQLSLAFLQNVEVVL